MKRRANVALGRQHNEFLGLLGTFYKSLRYDRFTLASVYDSKKEKDALCRFLSKHLQVDLKESSPLFGIPNDARYRNFIRKIVTRISGEIYVVIERRASELNLYTYELRDGSKAQTVFLGQADIPSEEVLWKELLIFFMNTKTTSGHIRFLRSITPLDFDPELANDYLECFQSDSAAAFVVDELEALYGELTDKKERLEIMKLIANPNVSFDSPEPEGEEDGEGEEETSHY